MNAKQPRNSVETAIEQQLRSAVRQAIEAGATLNSIAASASLDWAQVRRFMGGTTLTLPAAGRLAAALGLELRQKARKKKASKLDT